MGIFDSIKSELTEELSPNEAKEFLSELKSLVLELEDPEEHDLKFSAQQIEDLKKLVERIKVATTRLTPAEGDNDGLLSGVIKSFL